jgi:ketosteroid isomerase-like protein
MIIESPDSHDRRRRRRGAPLAAALRRLMRAVSASAFRCAAVVAAALVAACATTGERVSIDELADAERAFSASAATNGVKAAFLGVLDDDAILFRPGPVAGREFIAARPEGRYRLVWRPERVAVSASGDLGYSSGPYRLTLDAKPGAPLFGEFLTVWRRGVDGRWRVLVDHGNGHEGEAGRDAPLVPIAPDGTKAARSVDAAEADFARSSASEGLASAYGAFASTRLRRLRDDSRPLDGAPTSSENERWTWTPTASGTSRANDLGWTLGRYRAPHGGGVFLRVWRAERGEWKILADVATPVEEPAK